MTGDQGHPWWRSEGDALAPDDDPVALHLAARNGVATAHGHDGTPAPDDGHAGPDEGHAPPDGGHAPPDDADGPPGSGHAPSGHVGGHGGDRAGHADHDPAGSPLSGDCAVCPVCRGLAHVRATHPEVADHLVEAARHLTIALREVIDGMAAGAGRSGSRGNADDAEDRSGARAHRPAHHSTPAARGTRSPATFQSIPLDDTDDPHPGPDDPRRARGQEDRR